MHTDVFLGTLWALSPAFFDRAAPLVIRWLQSGKSLEDFPLAQKKARFFDDDDDEVKEEYYPFEIKDDIAVIPVQGVLTAKGNWCAYGTQDMVNWLAKCNEKPEVRGIVLDVDSPGGSVSGIQELYRAVKNSEKPVVAIARNNMHSAAYWACAGAKYIYANTPNSSFIGSIGVYMVHSDWSKWNEQEGVTYTYITSDKAIYKTIGNTDEPLSDEARDFFQKELNLLHDAFIRDVEKGRTMRKLIGEENYTGASWDGEESLRRGLVDAIADKGLETAIAKAQDLAGPKPFTVFI